MGIVGNHDKFKKTTVRVTKCKQSKKTNKKDKPKHLNRKLESAANEDERIRILRKIQELEDSKKKSSSDKCSEEGGRNVASTVLDRDSLAMGDSDEGPKVANGQLPSETEKDATQQQNAPEDDGNENPENPKRQRGKRRRGRQDTSRVVEQAIQEDTKREEVVKAKRYCIGRKPVTDFQIGKTYSGKIIYSKPYGIFIDIGCHSDAFCHVSRLDDDFVEDVEHWRAERGDTVQTARVVEIDRIRKRITVSLQSEARVTDEMMSVKARQERRQKFHQKMKGKPESSRQQGCSAAEPVGSFSVEQMTVPRASEQDGNRISDGPAVESMPAIDAKAKAAEEKRQRKLARRAARRALKESGEQYKIGAKSDDE